MRLLSAACLFFLFLGTGCYTQIYIAPDEPEAFASAPAPVPSPLPPGPHPLPPRPPVDDPIIIAPPPPPPIVIIVTTTTPSEPMPIRDSGTQRPSVEHRDDRSSRPFAPPSRNRQ